MSESLARFAVFGFDSTHDALKAESVLLAAGEEVALIPTPKVLGTLCGFAVRVRAERQDAALDLMADADLMPTGYAEIEDRA